MERRYAPIASQPMCARALVRQPALEPAPRVALDDPAESVMTDLTRVPAVLVDPGRQAVRGVFSASQLERQLGQPVPARPVAHTFAEIEAALAH